MNETGASRLTPLDGLRGIAAVAVLFHHLALITPGILNNMWPMRDTATVSVLWRALTFPLHLAVSSGLEAVFVFFVLSGLVLTLPVVRDSRYDWRVYYPRRLIRLVLPVLASIGLALILILVVPRHAVDRTLVLGRSTDWLTADNTVTINWTDIVDTLNLFGPSQPLNNPLWSLGWELVFSVALPLVVFVAVFAKARRLSVALVVLSLVLTTVGGALGIGALLYLPIFVVGAVIALSLDDIARFFERLSDGRGGVPLQVILLIGSLGLISVPWIGSGIDGRVYGMTVGLSIIGCAGLVVLVLNVAWMESFFQTRVVQWLGRISFSLYLVHVPVIVTVAFLVGVDRWVLSIPIGIVASLLIAWLFYRFVERPSHALSRWTGSRVSAAVERSRAARAAAEA